MRDWASVAAFGLLLAAMPALAQRGGGHSSGGHGGFVGSAGGGSHFGGMRSGSGTVSHGFASSRQSLSGPSSLRPAFSHPSSSSRSFSRAYQRSFARPGYSGNRSGGSRFRSFGPRNCCGRYGYGYPWGHAGFYDPYWWWDSGSSNDDDRANEIALANQMNEQSLEQQQMRDQADQDLYPAVPRQSGSDTLAAAEVLPPTVLVFRNQSKLEVQNYAIVGQTLWSFSPRRTQKIPLSDLDLEATTKANEQRGVDFQVPGSPQGQ